MIHEATKEEMKECLEELLKFCRENQSLMYSHMLTIKQIRKEPEDKILDEKRRKQVEEYQKTDDYKKWKER